MNKLKAARETLGMTQKELANKSNVSRTTISNIENIREGETLTVKSSTLIAIAKALNKKVSDIFF